MLPLMLQLDIASVLCIGLMFFGVGMFILGPFFIGWLDERDDRYAGIKWSKKLGTSRCNDRAQLYRTWEEKQAIAKRNSEALDIYITRMHKDGSFELGVKNGACITVGSTAQRLCESVQRSGENQESPVSSRNIRPTSHYARAAAEQEWRDMVAGILHDLATKSTRELISGYYSDTAE